MSKLWKIIGIVAAVGAIFVGAGLALGANTGGISWSRRGGFSVGSSELLHVHYNNLGTFENISVNVSSTNVRIVEADYFGFEARYRSGSNLRYSVENGTLTITQDRFSVSQITFFGFGDWESSHITIFIPRSAVLNDVNIQVTSGRITIDRLDCDNLTARSSSGSVTVNNLTSNTAHIRATSGRATISNATVHSSLGIRASSGSVSVTNAVTNFLELQTSSGRISASRIEANGLSAEASSGSINLSGVLNGTTNVRTSSGRVTLNVDGARDDFNINTSVSSGRVRIDGQRGVAIISNNADNTITARASSGNIDINFTR